MTRAYYANYTKEFINADNEKILGKLVKNHTKINDMKANTALYIEKNRKHFIKTITNIFN